MLVAELLLVLAAVCEVTSIHTKRDVRTTAGLLHTLGNVLACTSSSGKGYADVGDGNSPQSVSRAGGVSMVLYASIPLRTMNVEADVKLHKTQYFRLPADNRLFCKMPSKCGAVSLSLTRELLNCASAMSFASLPELCHITVARIIGSWLVGMTTLPPFGSLHVL